MKTDQVRFVEMDGIRSRGIDVHGPLRLCTRDSETLLRPICSRRAGRSQ
jgi:hypothetical protein